ncbi:glycosyltransferase [Rhodocyclus purpureus]|uniref:glycosyltransferase n=1 Tax=Rhodocyclus purpureus TaxID=1067 RepID=UPI00191223D1|nr:glycosyltransferase [Rhodocyclus purpureus]MBK5915159.1 glycosyl transferase [Rhodocyclus purpureus]
MKILFVHQNFPGQYKHLAPALAADPANEVVALRLGEDAAWGRVRVLGYKVAPEAIAKADPKAVHPWLSDLQVKVLRGEAASRRALALRAEGFVPDVIVAHPGWGETLFLREIWPQARLGLYCEFFYRAEGSDVGFDPEFPQSGDALANASRLRLKNANALLSLEEAARGLSPTAWQKSQYPQRLQAMIDVIHDGIDTRQLCPDGRVSMRLNGSRTLTRADEVITFVNRNLEPYRGYHVFMRALPEILVRRPQARVIIVGGNEVSYGAAPPPGKTWRSIFFDEVRERIDASRVHFVGRIPYPDFVRLLQLSSAHVYLTYPFVLSWSLLEAMSVACPIVASRTPPVEEALADEETALLTDFFDPEALADAVCRLLADRALGQRLGSAARKVAVERYDLASRCLPAQIEWVRRLAAG